MKIALSKGNLIALTAFRVIFIIHEKINLTYLVSMRGFILGAWCAYILIGCTHHRCNHAKLYCDLETYLGDTISVKGEYSVCAGIGRFRTKSVNGCKSDCRMTLVFDELNQRESIQEQLQSGKDCEEYFFLEMVGVFERENIDGHFATNNSRLIILSISKLKGPITYKLKKGHPPEAN